MPEDPSSAARTWGLSDVQQIIPPVCFEKEAAPGKNIKHNQPDVEVLAILLRQFPCTKAGFEQVKGDREWTQLQFCVMRVGPPGFSSVPYCATQKKREPTKPLYDVNEHGRTRFYTFEKGRTNKDKGERVVQSEEKAEDEGGAEPVCRDWRVVLEPGVCLTNFVREEIFSKEEGFVTNAGEEEILQPGALVYIQLSTSNVEQAKKGNMIKARRIQVVSKPHAGLSVGLAQFPTSEEGFEQIMARAHHMPGIASNLYSGNTRVFAPQGSPDAYVVQTDDGVCLVNYHQDVAEIRISDSTLLSAMGTSDMSRALKLANVACATQSLQVVVRFDQVFSDGQGEAMNVVLDVNRLLSLKAMQETHSLEDPASDRASVKNTFLISRVAGQPSSFVFKHPTGLLNMPDAQGCVAEHQIVFVVKLEEEEQEAWTTENYEDRVVSDGCASKFYPLTVWLFKDSVPWHEVCSKVSMSEESSGGVRLMKLQARKQATVGKKRQRPQLVGHDPRDK